MTNGFGVVLLNWNNADDTIAALDSLWSAIPRPLTTVVVDSGSVDDSMEKIRQWSAANGANSQNGDHVWLELIELGKNLGFAGGNNVGLRQLLSRSDITHVLLLNNDAMVERSFFAELNEALESVPDAGLMTGTIFEHPNRRKIWYAGGREVPFRALIKHKLVIPVTGEPVDTEFVSGCAMLIGRRVTETIGLLPEVYFPLYCEDAEYSFRAREAGFPVVYAPNAIVYHKIGATVGPASTSPYIMRAQVRHRVMFVRRNFRGVNRVAALTYLIATKPVKAIVETIAGRPRMGWAVLAGTVDGFLHSET